MVDEMKIANNFTEKKGLPASQTRQYSAAFIATLGAFIFGNTLGWTSTVKTPLQQGGQYAFPVSLAQVDLIGGLMPIGAFCSIPIVGWMVSHVGRKTSMLALCIPAVLGFALMAWAQNVAMFYTGRFFTGMASGGLSVVVPIYTGELAEARIRGSLGSYFQLQITLGILYTYVFGYLLDIFWLTILCTLIPVVYFVLLLFIPESPIYHLEKDDITKAKQCLKRFRGDHFDIESEFETLQQNIAEMRSQKLTLFEAFRTKVAKKSLVITLGLVLLQKTTGIDSVVFYTESIFRDAGSTFNSNVETIITGAISVVMTYVSLLVVDRLGRRPLLLFSEALNAVCNLLLGAYFFFQHSGYDMTSFTWAPVCLVCVFLVTFALGMGPIPWVYLGEVFPRQIAGYAVSISCMFNFLCIFFITNYFDQINLWLVGGASFFIFSAFSFFGVIFIFFVVIETKNKNLEQILEELS